MRKIKHFFEGKFFRARSLKNRFLFIVAGIMMIIALCLLLYPPLSNYLANRNCSIVRSEYYQTVENTDNETINAILSAAQNYNSALLPIRCNAKALDSPQANYNELLNLKGNGIMGYIDIPNINVYLPIFHGTGMESLDNGVGHLVGSSLPIGGAGTHTILTGHSGVAGMRLFSDLDQMTVGNVFYLHILNDTLAYEVVEIHTVNPYDTSFLSIQEDKDRCTLITCTPFGVNTHRLLVQADRISLTEAQKIQETDTQGSKPVASTWKKHYYLGLILGGVILICLILIVILCIWLKAKIKRSLKHSDKSE